MLDARVIVIKMKIRDYVCKPGKSSGFNEDYIGFQDHCFAILMDGSTGLGKKEALLQDEYHTMAQWFVNRMGELIGERIEQADDLRIMLKECVSVLRKEYESLMPNDAPLSFSERRLREPSASFALLRERNQKIELYLLGDISVFLKYSDGRVERLYDDSVESLDKEAIHTLMDVSGGSHISISDAMKTARIQNKLKENRLKKNSGEKDGYWILGLDLEALDHGQLYQWDKDSTEIPLSIVMCSDGFAAFGDRYEFIGSETEKGFYAKIEKDGLKKIYKKIRKIEKKDKKCMKYPRFKPSDDAAALLIDLSAEENKKVKSNVRVRRFWGHLHGFFMTLSASQAVFNAIVVAIASIALFLLKLFLFKDNDLLDTIASTGVAFTAVYAVLDCIRSYQNRKRGVRTISDPTYKEEIQKNWKLGSKEVDDGFSVKKFFNGSSDEYFIESDSFNNMLQSGEQITYTDMRRRYRLPDPLLKLVPKIMVDAFRKKGVFYNSDLIRQASHIDLDEKEVLLQKATYFSGQCSHEIVYKQFSFPEQIGLSFEGKTLLVSEENVLYDLSHSSCANFIGVSTLTITKDNYIIIGKQGAFSKANPRRYAPSGSGSVQYSDIRKAGKYYGKSKKSLTFNDILTYAMQREFCEECNYELEQVHTTMKTMLVGYVRLLERGGKPDYFGISYLDQKFGSSVRKKEYGLMDKMKPIPFCRLDDIPGILEEFFSHELEKVVNKKQPNSISIQLYLLIQYIKTLSEQGLFEKKMKELGCPTE